MNELSAAELDLLTRIDAKEELRPFFFKKAKGLKWFDELDTRNYFNPTDNPAPVPAEKEGYVSVPSWPATDYLVATSPELLIEENRAFAERVLEIIRAVTDEAIKRQFGNYRTWWQFSKIIQNVPLDLILDKDFVYIDYWLNDKYGSDLTAGQLGGKWLVALLEKSSKAAKSIALNLLKILYKASFHTEGPGDGERQKAVFRFGTGQAQRITKAVADRSGRVIGRPAVSVFQDELERVLRTLENDSHSYLWRAAVEDHSQNQSAGDVEDFLIVGLRDSLGAWVREAPEASLTFVKELLQSSLLTFRRVAIHTINQNYRELNALVNYAITEDNFKNGVRHEMWRLFRDRYPLFPETVKERIRRTIKQLTRQDEEGVPNARASANTQAIWLAAIKDHEEALHNQYQACVEQAGFTPNHPDFLVSWHFGPIIHESPKSREELLAMNIDKLIEFLDGYEDPGHFQGVGLEGLVKELKVAVKAAPLEFAPNLQKFTGLDNAYVYVLIEAFSELWTEKIELPWDDVWWYLLNFCRAVIQQEAFWLPENAEQRAQFVANRHWLVGSIGRLIEAGAESDEHAFSPNLLDQAQKLLLTLLKKQPGEEFKPGSDAVSIAINSPRGLCLRALINLALRSCRLADKESNDHAAAWSNLQPAFERELAKADEGEYEFITLLVECLPNFLYMSTEWISENIERIFDRERRQKWLCAMQAYAYVNNVYKEIYNYLKFNEHFIHALDDENLKHRVSDKIIQNIVIAYLRDYENLANEDSLIQRLLSRARYEELSQLIWFIWTLREKNDQALYDKIMALWPRLLQAIDTENREGQKLASQLTTWSVFITEVNDANRDLILKVAEFAEEDHNSYELLNSIARFSAKQLEEAAAIWREMLKGSVPDYPEKAIRETFANLVKSGDNGRREALAIADEYIKRGNDKPHTILQKILNA